MNNSACESTALMIWALIPFISQKAIIRTRIRDIRKAKSSYLIPTRQTLLFQDAGQQCDRTVLLLGFSLRGRRRRRNWSRKLIIRVLSSSLDFDFGHDVRIGHLYTSVKKALHYSFKDKEKRRGKERWTKSDMI